MNKPLWFTILSVLLGVNLYIIGQGNASPLTYIGATMVGVALLVMLFDD